MFDISHYWGIMVITRYNLKNIKVIRGNVYVDS